MCIKHSWHDIDRTREAGGGAAVRMLRCPPHIPHGLTWDWTQASPVGGPRLAAWAVAWPVPREMLNTRNNFDGTNAFCMCGSLLQPRNTLAVSWWLSLHQFHWLISNGHNVTRRSNENGVYGCATCFQTSSREVSIAPFLRSYPFIVTAGPWDATLVAVGTVSYSGECIWPWRHRQSR